MEQQKRNKQKNPDTFMLKRTTLFNALLGFWGFGSITILVIILLKNSEQNVLMYIIQYWRKGISASWEFRWVAQTTCSNYRGTTGAPGLAESDKSKQTNKSKQKPNALKGTTWSQLLPMLESLLLPGVWLQMIIF